LSGEYATIASSVNDTLPEYLLAAGSAGNSSYNDLVSFSRTEQDSTLFYQTYEAGLFTSVNALDPSRLKAPGDPTLEAYKVKNWSLGSEKSGFKDSLFKCNLLPLRPGRAAVGGPAAGVHGHVITAAVVFGRVSHRVLSKPGQPVQHDGHRGGAVQVESS
jgi:hypothetical protein